MAANLAFLAPAAHRGISEGGEGEQHDEQCAHRDEAVHHTPGHRSRGHGHRLIELFPIFFKKLDAVGNLKVLNMD